MEKLKLDLKPYLLAVMECESQISVLQDNVEKKLSIAIRMDQITESCKEAELMNYQIEKLYSVWHELNEASNTINELINYQNNIT